MRVAECPRTSEAIAARSARVLLPSLSDTARRWAAAGAASVAAHAVALQLAMWMLPHTTVVPPPKPGRVISITLAPPPPRGAAMSVPVAPLAPDPAVEQPTEVEKLQRLVVSKKPTRTTPPQSAQAALPRGDLQGAVGRVDGGVVGGRLSGEGTQPLPADAVVRPAVVLSRVMPTYPPLARARGLEGHVILTAVVDQQGRVEEAITVTQSMPLLDAAAVEALRQWRFEPGRDRDGTPVRVRIEMPIRFQLR
jgi:TonB family protein